jgi:hypothetical protein
MRAFSGDEKKAATTAPAIEYQIDTSKLPPSVLIGSKPSNSILQLQCVQQISSSRSVAETPETHVIHHARFALEPDKMDNFATLQEAGEAGLEALRPHRLVPHYDPPFSHPLAATLDWLPLNVAVIVTDGAARYAMGSCTSTVGHE